MDASTDLADGGCGFNNGDAVPSVREAVCGSETAETASDDNDRERKRGFATGEEVEVLLCPGKRLVKLHWDEYAD